MESNWIPSIVAVGALAFVWWDIRRSRIMNDATLKKALYKEDGITVYIPRGECTKNLEAFCKKTDEIKKLVAEMDEKRDLARKNDADKWEAVNRTLGKVEGYMERHA